MKIPKTGNTKKQYGKDADGVGGSSSEGSGGADSGSEGSSGAGGGSAGSSDVGSSGNAGSGDRCRQEEWAMGKREREEKREEGSRWEKADVGLSGREGESGRGKTDDGLSGREDGSGREGADDGQVGRSFLERCLDKIEKAGNRLPHPITLFGILVLLVIILSAICRWLGVSASGELLNRRTGEMEWQTVTVRNLLNGEGLVYMLTSIVPNFTGFAPLGIGLVAMFGIGLLEDSGLIGGALKGAVRLTPKKLLTPAVVFLGILSNLADAVGYMVLIPISALMYMACGRHPLAGLAAAFAGVSGGFSANLLIGALDPLLCGITSEAAGLVNPSYVVAPTANWYFMIASTFLITLLGTVITEKLVAPRLGTYGEALEGSAAETGECQAAGAAAEGDCRGDAAAEEGEYRADAVAETGEYQATAAEKQALKAAGLTLLLLLAALAAVSLPAGSVLRAEDGTLLGNSPFMEGIIPIITLVFFVPSVVYGFRVGKYRGEKDVCGAMGRAMESMGFYIALTFVSAQFISFFGYTNLGTILALRGADFLRNSGIGTIPAMLLFVLFSAFVNLFIGSASAKWALLAPVFVPMFMLLGYTPELVQVAYRIGDSCTNVITPMMSYFAMILVFVQKYDRNAGIGTLVSMMLPYSLCFLAGWSLLLIFWILLGLPLGPGAGLYLG